MWGIFSNSRLVLHDELEKLRKENGAESLTELTKDLHFYPDLHGKTFSCGFRCGLKLKHAICQFL